MPKVKTPQEVYDDLATQGLYEEAHCDKDEITKVKTMTWEDYEYGKQLRKQPQPNWRVIFNIHYDVLRELCDQLMRFKEQKTSNHQGLFAFLVLNWPELELDWEFFDIIRNIRNQNKYKGRDVGEETWKKIEVQMDLYISTIKKKLEENLEM